MSTSRLLSGIAVAAVLFLTSCSVSRRTECDDRTGLQRSTESVVESAEEAPMESGLGPLSPAGRTKGLYAVFKNNTNLADTPTEPPVGFVIALGDGSGLEYWILSDTEEAPPKLSATNRWLHLQMISGASPSPAEVCNAPNRGGLLSNPHVWTVQVMVVGEAQLCSELAE